MVAPMPGGDRNALGAGRGRDRRRRPRVHDRRRAGRRRARVRHADDSRGPQDHGTRQRLRREAKRRVFGTVGIDMIAGPSEILVLADGTTPPDWVAMDLFSQAEHDPLAQSILLTPDAAYLERVREAIERLLPTMQRRAIIARLARRPRRADPVTRSMEEACEISNRIAPEHLEVERARAAALGAAAEACRRDLSRRWTSESLGDYCAGPNHVLPTAGTARFSSPLGVYDFQKRTSLIEVSERGSAALGPIAAELARGEGLEAHARAAEMRLASKCRVMSTAPDGRYARVLRQDVQSMHAYAIQPSRGLVKLDAMENPFRLPEALQDELGRAPRPRRDQPLSDRLRRRRHRRAVRVRRASRGLQADARQRLRRADLAARARLRHSGRDDPRAAARLRDVRDVGEAPRAALRRRAD